MWTPESQPQPHIWPFELEFWLLGFCLYCFASERPFLPPLPVSPQLSPNVQLSPIHPSGSKSSIPSPAQTTHGLSLHWPRPSRPSLWAKCGPLILHQLESTKDPLQHGNLLIPCKENEEGFPFSPPPSNEIRFKQ